MIFYPELLTVIAEPSYKVHYDGMVFKRADCPGSRACFNIFNKFFVKACYAAYGTSQCSQEAFTYGKIAPEDMKYFPKLLWTCDFKGKYHWNVWEFIKLVSHDDYGDTYYRCRGMVDYLCDKYGIGDMYFNGNWYIHNGQPLIVDLGCD